MSHLVAESNEFSLRRFDLNQEPERLLSAMMPSRTSIYDSDPSPRALSYGHMTEESWRQLRIAAFGYG